MANESLKKLYVDELKDLFSAENQLLKGAAKDGQSCVLKRTSGRLRKSIWNRPKATSNAWKRSSNL